MTKQKKFYIIIIILLTLTFATKVFASLTFSTDTVAGSGIINLNPTGQPVTINGDLTVTGTCTGCGGGGGTPGSPVNSIQFNDAGSFGGDTNLQWNPTNSTGMTGLLVGLTEPDLSAGDGGGNSISFISNSGIQQNWIAAGSGGIEQSFYGSEGTINSPTNLTPGGNLYEADYISYQNGWGSYDGVFTVNSEEGSNANFGWGNGNTISMHYDTSTSTLSVPIVQATTRDSATGASDAPARNIVSIHDSTATPIEVDTGLAGFSTGYEWRMKNADGDVVPTATLDTLWRDPTTGDNTVALVLQTLQYGTMENTLLIDDWNNNFIAGVSSGRHVTTANNLTLIGESAGKDITTSSGGLVAVGTSSAGGLTSGTGIFIGPFSLASGPTVSNETVIGTNINNGLGASGGSNTVTIGNNAVTDVYFGSATPAAKIHAAGGSEGHATCWKADASIGYCSSVVAADGTCTCN